MTTIESADLANVSGGGWVYGGGTMGQNMAAGAQEQADRYANNTLRALGPAGYLVAPVTATVGAAVGAAKGFAHTLDPAYKMPAPMTLRDYY